jgi:drug/metabolite transporter (DMT)-like permease
MARLFWTALLLGAIAALVAGASWALAYNTVGSLLGDPPPQMGTQTTTFLWHGAPQLEGGPRVWSFAYAPTLIPGAQSVRIYVSPLGRILETDPADLAARVKLVHAKGY